MAETDFLRNIRLMKEKRDQNVKNLGKDPIAEIEKCHENKREKLIKEMKKDENVLEVEFLNFYKRSLFFIKLMVSFSNYQKIKHQNKVKYKRVVRKSQFSTGYTICNFLTQYVLCSSRQDDSFDGFMSNFDSVKNFFRNFEKW